MFDLEKHAQFGRVNSNWPGAFFMFVTGVTASTEAPEDFVYAAPGLTVEPTGEDGEYLITLPSEPRNLLAVLPWLVSSNGKTLEVSELTATTITLQLMEEDAVSGIKEASDSASVPFGVVLVFATGDGAKNQRSAVTESL